MFTYFPMHLLQDLHYQSHEPRLLYYCIIAKENFKYIIILYYIEHFNREFLINHVETTISNDTTLEIKSNNYHMVLRSLSTSINSYFITCYAYSFGRLKKMSAK